jgi:hypothetical protein
MSVLWNSFNKRNGEQEYDGGECARAHEYAYGLCGRIVRGLHVHHCLFPITLFHARLHHFPSVEIIEKRLGKAGF